MSNLVTFENADNESNILRIGGKSFLPPDMEWPTNPNGEKMVFIFNIPTNFLNAELNFNYPKDKVISVFTTYNREDYFLDSIVYNGDIEEFQNIKNGYTKVVLHSAAAPRNDADFLIPAREIVIDKEMNESDEDYGSLIGANPVFLQNEKLELDSYQFCMQIYGEDFPEEFQDIFCLDDAIGYLFLSKEEKADDVGVFFVQCT